MSRLQQPEWAVTDVGRERILHQSSQLSPRIFDLWRGSNRLWRSNAAGLRELSEDEYRMANEQAQGRR